MIVNRKISIVIRNKNEANALEKTLSILTKLYKDDFNEIILVDNESKDNSVKVANKYNCKIVTINNFTYGKALNKGINVAKNRYVLLLSSHAIPIGKSFFITALDEFRNNDKLAGIRFINSFQNYERALKNNFHIVDGLKYGLMNACAMIDKEVWKSHKFDENIVASEDKKWSKEVLKEGYFLKDCREAFYYFVNRDTQGSLSRLQNETIAEYQLNKINYPSKAKIILLFIYKIGYQLPREFINKIWFEFKLLKVKINLKSKIKQNDNHSLN